MVSSSPGELPGKSKIGGNPDRYIGFPFCIGVFVLAFHKKMDVQPICCSVCPISLHPNVRYPAHKHTCMLRIINATRESGHGTCLWGRRKEGGRCALRR